MLGQEKEQGLRFTMESVEYLDRVRDHIWEVLRDRAMSRVLNEGRRVVTADDIRACLHETFLHEMQEEVQTARVADR
jgi:histone H3/H4